MSLEYFQEQLQTIYEIDVDHSVLDFLISDNKLADSLSASNNTRNNDERLLIVEYEDELDLSLYISADVLEHLKGSHPVNLIKQGKYSEFCLMLEGVSHFLYVVWNAGHHRQVTLLEMELQAEIDKFILLQSLIDKQSDNNAVNDLRVWLFERHTFDNALSPDELERYQQANYFAGKYCMSLQQNYKLSTLNKDLLNELRRLYRMSQQQKMRYINNLH
ncbi:MAG TPA: hypothetical protein EYQ42_10760 [Thiotrichaceae bacterium]|jgi:hypothetical protein|nr:hypothetical protein [Thiotrichaceae bacterium]HIM08908.1 hypothetical protein [Gammaproteobacteria bacterium]